MYLVGRKVEENNFFLNHAYLEGKKLRGREERGGKMEMAVLVFGFVHIRAEMEGKDETLY